MSNHAQRGFTLAQLALVMAIGAFTLAATVAYSVPFLQRERLRSATYDIRTLMQLAKVESVARNRPCRFVVDFATHSAEVRDGMGTATAADDELLSRRELPESIVIARPDAGAPVTLEVIGGGNSFQTVFASDGVVAQGAGSVFLSGAGGYRSVTVFAAGGMQVLQWNGSVWVSEHAD